MLAKELHHLPSICLWQLVIRCAVPVARDSAAIPDKSSFFIVVTRLDDASHCSGQFRVEKRQRDLYQVPSNNRLAS